jgi:hypothetical protein
VNGAYLQVIGLHRERKTLGLEQQHRGTFLQLCRRTGFDGAFEAHCCTPTILFDCAVSIKVAFGTALGVGEHQKRAFVEIEAGLLASS